ncbi:hypothetical protein GCM10009097_50300 [Pigmentiphaga daeguensis]|uniref:Uncharacterized protein n=1 Tax=Pigmentiphaga daeguensis TaxID=414049 RepID=A0ABN1CUP6_9BURK
MRGGRAALPPHALRIWAKRMLTSWQTGRRTMPLGIRGEAARRQEKRWEPWQRDDRILAWQDAADKSADLLSGVCRNG